MILEEARAGLLTDPFNAVPKIHQAAKFVLHFLSLLGPSATPLVDRDLQAQVSILRADAFRVFATVARDPVQARESSESSSRHLIQARLFAAQGTGSLELAAMLFLAEAQSSRRRGCSRSTLQKAAWLLRRAGKKLLMVEGQTPLISARRSELIMELAAVQGELTAWKAAWKASLEALSLLDDFSPPFVRITLVRHLVRAEAKLYLLGTSLSNFTSALQMPWVRKHLSFFHSRIYGRTTGIETPAFRSFAQSLAKLGFGNSAVPVLALLGRLYAREGYQPALMELATELVDLSDAESMALLVRTELRFLGPHISSTTLADHLRK